MFVINLDIVLVRYVINLSGLTAHLYCRSLLGWPKLPISRGQFWESRGNFWRCIRHLAEIVSRWENETPPSGAIRMNLGQQG